MNVWIKRGGCLGLLVAVVGCGDDELATAPPIPKDFKPVQAAPTGVLPMPKNLQREKTTSGAGAS